MNFPASRKIGLIVIAVLLLSASFAFATTIDRVSVDNLGDEGNAISFRPAVSSDGRYVAFESESSDLVSGDSNGSSDIFVYDRNNDTIEMVSVSSAGVKGNLASNFPTISSDGRYVAFASDATNLVSGDTNGTTDVFVYDRNADTIEMVSISSAGVKGNAGGNIPSISADGRYVSFFSFSSNLLGTGNDNNGVGDVFVYDRNADTIERVSIDDLGAEADDSSFYSAISSDGRYVVFTSLATNLVSGDTNGVGDVFVYDRNADTIERVSIDDLGVEADGFSASSFPTISSNGRYVAFASDATNLVSGDTNGTTDVFVYDRNADTIERVSVDDAGVEGDGASGVTGVSGGEAVSISADGGYVTFASQATNLAPGDTNGFSDVFVYDLNNDNIKRISVDANGIEGDNASYTSSISSDNQYIVFSSNSSNFVSLDANGAGDVFIRFLNDSPSDIDLSNTEVEEEQPAGTNVGTLSAVDLDADTYTYSLNCSVPGADDAQFSISGDILLTAATFDFETKASYDICVHVDDGNGGMYDKNFTITILDIVDGSGGGDSSRVTATGSQSPLIKIRENRTQTNSRLVDLEVWTAVSVTHYEISNTPDFAIKETYNRESLMNSLSWDICKGSKVCVAGNKKIYARFYMGDRLLANQELSIDYIIPRECPYFKQYLRMGSKKNTPEEVIKMQAFLNEEIGSNIPVDGHFGKDTDTAVRIFQEKYPSQIIRPWPTLDHSTGWWYITTSGYANVLVGC